MRQFVLFSCVGVLGSISNLVCFYFLQLFGVQYILNACLCFCIAVSQNYILNSLLTFSYSICVRAYLLYVSVNIFGLGINLIVLFVCQKFMLSTLLAFITKNHAMLLFQALGIVCAMVSNFCLSKFFIFTKGGKQ